MFAEGDAALVVDGFLLACIGSNPKGHFTVLLRRYLNYRLALFLGYLDLGTARCAAALVKHVQRVAALGPDVDEEVKAARELLQGLEDD